MAIVTEIMNFSLKNIEVTYDNEKVKVYPSEVEQPRDKYNYLFIEAVEGIEMSNNVNIDIHRNDRTSPHTVTAIKDGAGMQRVFEGTLPNHYIKFEINLTVVNTSEITVDTSNMNFSVIETNEVKEFKTRGSNYSINIQTEVFSPEPTPIYETIKTINAGETFELEKDDYRFVVNAESDYEIETARLEFIKNNPEPNHWESFTNRILVFDSNSFDNYDEFLFDIVTNSTVEPEPEPEPEPVNTVRFNGSNVAIIMTSDELEYTLNSGDSVKVFSGQYTIKAIPNYGYKLLNVSYSRRQNPEYEDTGNFEISEDGKEGILNYEIVDSSNSLIINAISESEDDQSIVSTFNKLYLMDNKKLLDLSRVLIGFSFEDLFEPINLDNFIINLIRFPFKIRNESIGSIENVHVGRYDFYQVQTEVLLTDFYRIELGDIEVKGKYNNSYDYVNTSAILHLPHTQSINVPIEYVMNETISIRYMVNLYSGDTTIILYSSKINEVFYNETVSIGHEIPFYHKESNSKVNNLQVSPPINNSLKSAYIEVIRNVPLNLNNEFVNTINYKGLIGDETGYLEIDNIILNGDMTSNDRANIKNILRSGVFINGEN